MAIIGLQRRLLYGSPLVGSRCDGAGGDSDSGPAKGLDRAAHAAAGWPVDLNRLVLGESTILLRMAMMTIMALILRVDGRRNRRRLCCGKVSFGLGSTEGACSGIVSAGGVLGRVESTEPDAGLLPRISDLGGESTPWSLSDASKPNFFHRVGRIGRDRFGC